MNSKTINDQVNISIKQRQNKIISYVFCPTFTPYYFDSNLTRFAGELSSDTSCIQVNQQYGKVSIGTGTFFVNSNSIRVRTF